MRILFLAGREISYPRNDVMIRALKRLGDVDVIGRKERGSILLRSLFVTLRSILSLRSREYDLVFVGFYGHLLMLPLSFWCPSPILFDAYISTYETLCFDRKDFSPHSLIGKLAYRLDKHASESASQVLLDTIQHVNYFREIFNLTESRLHALPVSCNEELFYPQDGIQIIENRIFFYSTYLPLHGVDTILEAAALHAGKDYLEFRLLGDGPGLRQAKQMATELDLKNVTFVPYVPLRELVDEIAVAGICLGGHFGNTDKADRVVPSKIYQIMAMAKPMIAGDTSANRDLLSHGMSAYLCPPSDPVSLADAICVLYKDSSLREKIGNGAREHYLQTCSEQVVTSQLEQILQELPNHT